MMQHILFPSLSFGLHNIHNRGSGAHTSHMLLPFFVAVIFYSLVNEGNSFSFPNPFLRLTTDRDVKELKRTSNTPPSDTGAGDDVYVGPPINRFLEKSLKNDDVFIPCSECMKLVDRYVGSCALFEAALKPLVTVRHCVCRLEQVRASDPRVLRKTGDGSRNEQLFHCQLLKM